MIDISKMNSNIYIFGAQSRAKTLQGYFEFLYPTVHIESFLVDNISDNDSYIKGIPVLEVSDEILLNKEYPVFIATKSVYHEDIENRLKKLGMKMIVPVSVQVDNELRNAYVERTFALENRRFEKVDTLDVVEGKLENLRAQIYVAHSVYDEVLNTPYNYPDYEMPIQVGAALTSEHLANCNLTDFTGDNISAKNRQYCELTAIYWLWKHAKDDIVGLAHYRRHFVLPDDWIKRMISNGVDVILPVPTFVAPNITDNYMERHDAADWEYLMQLLEEKYPQDYEVAKKVFGGNLYSPCNMFIMKRSILDELCDWMFPILDTVVEHGGEKEDTYLNRYPGFISERLITLFFRKNSERFFCVYADKNFLQ